MEFSRQEQLDAVVAALERHADFGRLLHTATVTHAIQVSHVEGLYNEVDKLTKGKSLVPTSDMLIDLVNSLISDTKGLVHRDTYLDRLKTFVPAGDNPNYPDVLIAIRIVQQSLDRFNSLLETETDVHGRIGTELKTILGALQVAEQDELSFSEINSPDNAETEEESQNIQVDEEDGDSETEIDDEEDGGDYDEEDDPEQMEEYQEYVRKKDVSARLDGGAISETWFEYVDGEHIFNFAKLDRRGIPMYEPPSEGITFIKAENDF